tara:strand:- start:843 stop:1001 length:159 start_codon:yes stop_codon:yes gene_type:complete
MLPFRMQPVLIVSKTHADPEILQSSHLISSTVLLAALLLVLPALFQSPLEPR